MSDTYSQINMQKTGDYIVDKSIDSLSLLDSQSLLTEPFKLKAALRPLFSRAAFMYDLREENWGYFLFAICRTEQILLKSEEFIPKNEISIYRAGLKKLKDIKKSFAKVYGNSFDIKLHSEKYFDRDSFYNNLPSIYYNTSLDDKRNRMIKEMVEIFRKIEIAE